MEVLNTLGHGLLEKVYEKAMAVEFGLRGVSFQQQSRFSVSYKGTKIDDYIPDLVVLDQVIVETKVIEKIADHEIGQVLNYLKITGLKVGLILNFKRARLEWKRIVF